MRVALSVTFFFDVYFFFRPRSLFVKSCRISFLDLLGIILRESYKMLLTLNIFFSMFCIKFWMFCIYSYRVYYFSVHLKTVFSHQKKFFFVTRALVVYTLDSS